MCPRRFPSPAPDPEEPFALLPPFAAPDETVAWLYGLRSRGIQPGLARIERLLSALGRPDRRFDSVVVAGTNGKGSAALHLEALARAAGLRTGLTLSPHLLSPTERILVDGWPISLARLGELVRGARPAIEAAGATFFESVLALALVAFAEAGVDVAILETGLGGRLDATNAVAHRGVLLTSVGLDHQDLLGESLRAIAAEKLGLAQAGRPMYLGDLAPELQEQARRHLAEVGAPCVDLTRVLARGARTSRSPSERGGPEGLWQRRMALLAAACFDDLARREGWPKPRAPIPPARVPYRYEVVSRAPLLRLDTAHNAPALSAVLRQWRRQERRAHRILVFGAMGDKRLQPVLAPLAASAATILVASPRWPRAADPLALAEALREAVPGVQRSRIRACPSVREALLAAREEALGAAARGASPSVLVTGSNFLVAEALDRLGVDDIFAPPHAPLWEEGRPLRSRHRPAREAAAS